MGGDGLAGDLLCVTKCKLACLQVSSLIRASPTATRVRPRLLIQETGATAWKDQISFAPASPTLIIFGIEPSRSMHKRWPRARTTLELHGGRVGKPVLTHAWATAGFFQGVGNEGSEGLKSASRVQGQLPGGGLGRNPQKLTIFSQNDA